MDSCKSTSTFEYFLERQAIEWTYPLCFLPRLGDSFFLEDEETISTEGHYANQLLLQPNANEMNNTQLILLTEYYTFLCWLFLRI